jgi:hypothetical protein
MSGMLLDQTNCLKKGLEMKAAGCSDEDLLQFLRGERASMMDSVLLIRRINNIPLREAQEIVHQSATWSDEKERHDRLQEVLLDSLQRLGSDRESRTGNALNRAKHWLAGIFGRSRRGP